MRFNPANIITVARLALVPILLCLAWHGHDHAFLGGLIAAFLSDIIDGQIARRFNLATPLGARLDSWADFATSCSLPFAMAWLLPEIFATQKVILVIALAAYLSPIAVGFGKFHSLTSYHTFLARVSAYAMGVAVVVLFAHGPVLPFQIAVGFLALGGLEEIAITLVLPSPRSNVHSLARVRDNLRLEQKP